ncbi:MAG TPA: gliding motility-associated C-terminal domain-containing protein [Flavipsychrobacter sp.]|nr:gliding motility-associated C-terminal domain-containing protein [Flavipsychrobacter sp.]
MKKVYTLLIWFFITYSIPAISQPGWNLKENSIWPCIMDSALDFTSGSPVKIKSGIQVYWCTGTTDMVSYASVCDPGGNMLFYTDGDSIWNKNNQVMPNGFIQSATSGSSQGLLIVPVLSNPNQYYLFSFEGPLEYVLSYTIIDLTLDHGLGDVVPGKRNIPLDSGLTDAIVATPGNNCDIWLISHDVSDTLFKSYHITTDGLDTAVVQSRVGSFAGFYGFLFTNFAVSPNRQKLAFAGWGLNGSNVSLLDFNAATGEITNPLVLDSFGFFTSFAYGVCFSPDNSKLYTTISDTNNYDFPGGWSEPCIGHIWQYDVSLSSASAIASSGIEIPQQYYYWWGTMISPPLRLGPDGKIYLPADDAYTPPEAELNDTIPYIGCINYPNLSGSACNFQCHAIMVSSPPSALLSSTCAAYTISSTGDTSFYIPGSELLPYALGADYVKPLLGDSAYIRTDTTVCLPLKDSITLHAPPGYFHYTWNDGSTDTVRKVLTPGTYFVHAQTYCHIRVDTFVIKGVDVHFSLGDDTTFCNAPFPYTLHVPVRNAAYSWQDGSKDSIYTVTQSGVYAVVVTNGNCHASDSVRITFINAPQHLGNDTVLCSGQPIQLRLQANVPAGGIVEWSNGTFDSSLWVQDTGSYWIRVTDGPCRFGDTINISMQICDCMFNMPSAFSPNNDGKNDLFRPIIQPDCPVTDYLFTIYNRWGQMVWMSRDPKQGWNGTFNGVPQELGTYEYIIQFNAGTKEKKHFQKGDVALVR